MPGWRRTTPPAGSPRGCGWGRGLAGIDGLTVGDVVTAEQMQALFGSGHHPLAHARREALAGPDLTEADYRAVTRLGQPFKVYPGDVPAFRVEVAARLAAWNRAQGLPADWPVPVDVRARVRTEVGVAVFRAEYGRAPDGPRELAAAIAKASRSKTTAVAGYDLTFSPVKSVSALWAVADPATAARIERAHQGAVREALAWIESHALYTRRRRRRGPPGRGASGWSRPRSPTATPAPVTRTCTPTSRSRTRSRPCPSPPTTPAATPWVAGWRGGGG